jgi:hypothetical protein
MRDFDVVIPQNNSHRAAVSIVTFVDERVDALERSIHSIRRLDFKEFEHIIVADGPPPAVREIEALVRARGPERATLLALKTRTNDWGVTPSTVGLSQSSGKYVCFLAAGNGYLPPHFDGLVSALENDPALGFAYSSCLYDGRRVLDAPFPRAGHIDLGQPLFRRHLFDAHLNGSLPFHGFGWDWRMIEIFLSHGVAWKHINQATLIHGLKHYPDLAAGMAGCSRDRPLAVQGVLPDSDFRRRARAAEPPRVRPLEALGRMPAKLPPVYEPFLLERSPLPPLPRDFAGFRDLHRGETMLVCGCGLSLTQIISPERFPTIGVNDSGRLFNPDYLVVVNPPAQFSRDRFRYVETSQARAIFTQLDLKISHPHVVKFALGSRGGTDVSDPHSLPYTRNSPYVALCLALFMGARRIGLVGVDFTDHHFFGTTGRHPLSLELNTIEAEYQVLARTCRNLGVEVYNLSANSALQAFPKAAPEQFVRGAAGVGGEEPPMDGSTVFFVNYRFLSCGEVFSDGFAHAARDLNLRAESAYWDDAGLEAKIGRFRPDLLFVVHGRGYAQRRGAKPSHSRTAVWLLDEPYEVDDTSGFSRSFGSVFLNDPSSLDRHRNPHFLPVCYDPAVCHYRPGPRPHRVGFIGGPNPAREAVLKRLSDRGLLSYTAGGPWGDPGVQRLSLGGNIPAVEATNLYKQTQIVVNVFRTTHHFNREHIPGVSMNPRIYEALACGALVVSEWRPEIEILCPELPMFESFEDMVPLVEKLLSDPARYDSLRKACIRRLAGHTYAHRLRRVLECTLQRQVAPGRTTSPAPVEKAAILPGWQAENHSAQRDEAAIVLRNDVAGQGSERGLTTVDSYADVQLSFEALVEPGASLVAKIHQQRSGDAQSNSYHFVLAGRDSYLARHNHVFHSIEAPRGVWMPVTLRWQRALLSSALAGQERSAADDLLPSGHCFLGVKGGVARVRHVTVAALPAAAAMIAHPTGRRFSAMPCRNLIYHLWPVKGSMWRWNLDQLKARIDLFNGRRIIGIVYDGRSEDPGIAQEYLAGHGCEFLIVPNQATGEVATFEKMLRAIASTDENEVTFYGHGKGVKHEPAVPEPVRRWAETSYKAALDDWPAVRNHLEQFALTGSFRMFGRFRPHRNIGDWHYSGTYFWMRHARVFSRDCFTPPQYYCGVEAWPGRYFTKDEGGCLLFDNPDQLAYREEFWQSRREEIARWEAARVPLDTPRDLSQPRTFEGFAWPRLGQRPDEFAWLLERLAASRPRSMLVMGSTHSGAVWHIARTFRALGLDLELSIVERTPGAELLESIEDLRTRFTQTVTLLEGDYTNETTRSLLLPHYDAVWIDGDHSYRCAKRDFDFAASLSPRLIALHNIVDSDWHAQQHYCVSRLWREIREQFPCEEISTGEWGGIGLAHLGLWPR